MTNSNLARAVINGILGRIRTAEQVKNSILNIKNRLEKKYQNRELSRDQYLWELEKEIDGKTILEWLHYYDSYILNCKYEIRKHKKTISNNKVLTVFLSLFVVLALFLSTFYLGPTMVGLVIQENVTDDVLLENITEDNVTLDNITEYAEENITEIIETNITKTTEDNITLENITLPDEIIPEDNITIPEENITASVDGVTIITTQLLAILGQPVQWKKHITLDEAKKIKINLPKEAVDISVKKIKEDEEVVSTITGGVISEIDGDNFLSRFFKNLFDVFRKMFGTITGQVIQEVTDETNQSIEIDDTATEYEIEYETPAPYVTEKETEKGKKVKLSGPKKIIYEDVLTFTDLDESLKIKNPSSVRVYWVEEDRYIPIQKIEDTDDNGIYDYVEWISPSSDDQTYELIIEITKAEHLDENREFVSDIYDKVYQLDDIWSETISAEHYARVTFEIPLDSSRDITIYPRVISGTPRIKVYEVDGTELIAEFTSINSNQYNKIFLTNLVGEQDVFDLKIINGEIEFDHIVDPIETLTPLEHENSELELVNLDSGQVSSITLDDENSITVGKGILLTVEMSELSGTINTLTDANCSLVYSTATGYPANSITFEVYDSFVGGNQVAISTFPASDGVDSLVHLLDLETTGLAASEVTTMVVYVKNTISTKPYDLYVDQIYCTIDYEEVAQDNNYPQFSNYEDNNATLEGEGTGWFNVTVENTNGTVLLEINGTNITATNLSYNVYNASHTFTSDGVYPYKWHSWGNGTNENPNSSIERDYVVNTTSNTAPTITFVESISAQSPSEGGVRSITFNFTVSDENGISDINPATAEARFQKTDEVTRLNTSCVELSTSGNEANYSCTIGMWYFDDSGSWDINITIQDDFGEGAENFSTAFTYELLTAMVMSPTALGWGTIDLTDSDSGSTNGPIILNNTGNDESLNINITAYDLQGLITDTEYIYANNFTVDAVTAGCSGIAMSNATTINITSVVLERGNNSINAGDATSGQEELYFCLKGVPQDISSQEYSSSGIGVWAIRIFLVLLTPIKKRKWKKKYCVAKDDKLVKAISLILDELKNKYSLGNAEVMNLLIKEMRQKYKITKRAIMELSEAKRMSVPVSVFSEKVGGLEALTKYMKENLGMSYREIAEELNRDQRTIWTAYNKVKKKQKEIIEFSGTEVSIPMTIFTNRKLTILAAVIIYLKDNGMKYSEIGKVLNRDQRNIWTIYSRAMKNK